MVLKKFSTALWLVKDANLSSYEWELKKKGTAKIHLGWKRSTSKIHHV